MEIKNTIIILLLILTISCKNEKPETEFRINCIEKSYPNSEYSDSILTKSCKFKNYLFHSIGTSDYKGRYSYQYELFKLNNNDTLKISNSDLFNEKSYKLEKLINKKLKNKYDSDSKIPEIKECMEFINFRYFKLNEFGISFNEKNEIMFNIDYGIGSACLNVSSDFVTIEHSDMKKYLK